MQGGNVMKKRWKNVLFFTLLFLVLGISCELAIDLNMKNIRAEESEILQGEYGDNIKWILKDNVLTIKGTGEIPAFFVEKMSDAYEDFYPEDIEKVKIGNGITKIGNGAFEFCDFMEEVQFSDSIKEIGSRAFIYCDELKKIDFPKALETIGDAAFSGCETIKYIEIPDSVTELGREVFSSCDKLEYVKLPKNIKVLRGRTFSRCKAITSIEIPEGVETMEYQAIISCPNLKYVIIPKSVVNMEHNCMGYEIGDAVIVGDNSSEASIYAQENHIKFISYDNWNCDHKYSYEVLKRATLKEDGLEIDRCEKCGKTILEQISHPVSLQTINTTNTYNGGKIEPKIEIKLANGQILENKYYQCTDAKNNIHPGVYKYTVLLQDKYMGTMEGTYTITKRPRTLNYSGKKEIVKSYDKPFRLNIRFNGTYAEMAYKVSDPQMLDIDESGNIQAKRVGRCTITVYVQEDHNYKKSNEIKVKVQIIPAKIKVKTLKAKNGRKIYIKWSRDTKVDGYYILCGFRSDMMYAKSIKTKTNKTTSATFKNLKRKKKYYVEIYGYKKVKEGKRYREAMGIVMRKKIKTK